VTDNPATGSPTQSPSPFSAPQISLPKGGGAVRGIDEKFSANPATGTGALNIPLAVSKGRSGFEPHLSLQYDSGSGNGIFGVGWSAALPSITRRTDKQLPQYPDCTESKATTPSHTFVLSGAEDLVASLITDATGATGFDEFERDGYHVQRYRPRIEGLFARIERWTSLDTGEEHWRSISRDNIVTVYGLDEASRIGNPEDSRQVFSWLICRSFDDKGNAILYEYVAENDRGVDLTKASECHRIRRANRYPKRILYGNRRPLFLDPTNASFRSSHTERIDSCVAGWMFEVVFDYGEGHYKQEDRDAQGRIVSFASSEAGPDWPRRQDPFSSYRSGFEIRNYRLCRRVLMFHRFPDELGRASTLVRSTAFEYKEKPSGSFLEQVVQSGHRLRKDGSYLTRSMPPVDFSYSSSPLEEPDHETFQVEEVDPKSLENLPSGIAGNNYRFVDLDGEGISGVLTEQDSAWFYKPNLGKGLFGAIETVATQPSSGALNDANQHLMDINGNGRLDLVTLSPSIAGFYERTTNDGWAGFRSFHSLPVNDWSDPNLRFVDLTGDGIADVLITDDSAFRWHPSLLEEGFGPAVRVAVPLEEGQGPHVLFSDAMQSIYLADMSGDGLSDIVRIRNGEVCYWPNQGYGKFGAKVTMDNSPWFDECDLFDQERVRLADTDGSGTTDIAYLGSDGIRIYLNEAGNGWSSAKHLRYLPAFDDLTSVTVADLLGRGTACLIWSSPLPGDSGRQLRYVDLMCGRKPHLLVRSVNNLGAETRIQYASSTQFFLADKAAGAPWVTRLPFPVHVVERVETFDRISRNRFVTRYKYHHGFYDGVEREFRGFGRVDQTDTEEFAALKESSEFQVGSNIDATSSVPPVLTRTWFHTGAYVEGDRISRHMAHEYYEEDGAGGTHLSREQKNAMLLPDTTLPKHLSPEEAREACRSLKGAMLRQEVYAVDGKEESGRPYAVTESNLAVSMLQGKGPNHYAVFFTHPREQLGLQYERKLYNHHGCRRADPRVSHTVTLEVDDYGNVLKAAAISYGRRFPDESSLLTDEDRAKQSQILVTVTESDYTNAIEEAEAYRTPLVSEQRVYELVRIAPCSDLGGITNRFRFEELKKNVARAGDGNHDLPFEDWQAIEAIENSPYRRLLSKTRTVYRANRLHRFLPLGAIESLALSGRSYVLAFTRRLLTHVYHPSPQAEDLLPDREIVLHHEGGYIDVDQDGNWWSTSGEIFFVPEECEPHFELEHALKHFFLPRRYRNPFGNDTKVVYDHHDLNPVETIDAVGNTARAEIDYRVVAPRLLTDANGNRSEVAFDALGLVAGLAVMGKTSQNLGDTLHGFDPDPSLAQTNAFLADPHGSALSLLGGATSCVLYDVERYALSKKPVFAAMIARETHVSDLQPGEQSKTQISFSYSDGFGREIQKKLQAEPGPVTEGGAVVNPRWIGSGWTIFNNKAKPVRQYEPFFSASHDFEFAAIVGVSPIVFYDPVGRVVATLRPNHSFEKVVFDPWRQANWDVNDTIAFDPRTDPDVGEFVARLPESDFLPTWYFQRISGTKGPTERTAAEKAARHADTPAFAHFDSLGRTFLSIADNGVDEPFTQRKCVTRMLLDIQGNQRAVIDPLFRIVMRHEFDMLGREMQQESMDAGARWLLNDLEGKPIRGWNRRRYTIRNEYDALRRPLRSYVQGGDAYERNANPFPCEILFERTVYGDSSECGFGEHRQRDANLRGVIYRRFDTAGVLTTDRYDFKGNILSSRRQFTKDYRNIPDWSHERALEQEHFGASTTYDALNRVVTTTTPDKSIYRPAYNEANLLDKIDVVLRGAESDGKGIWTPFVGNIDYNAKGQRTRIDYANSASTLYEYDPETFRLIRLRTTRSHEPNGFAKQHFANPIVVQDLHYTYDPVGNITQIADASLRTVFHDNTKIDPVSHYTYDPLYRLIEATGRENYAQSGFEFEPPNGDYRDYPFVGATQFQDSHALQNYVERYDYDAVGNCLCMAHRGRHNSWTRRYAYNEESPLERSKKSNRLSHTHLECARDPQLETYLHDAHGNMVQMPHLPVMQWDFMDRLCATSQQVVKCGSSETTFYLYDRDGQRVRKVTARQGGTKRGERLYLGRFEVYREFEGDGTTKTLERETLHMLDDKRRIALVDTKTVDQQSAFCSSESLVRYQLANHLESASLELDEAGGLISYAEYSPYGNTVYQTGRNAADVKLTRYRYTGKERDDENGFTYHGARYFVPWLARWTCCDPAGLADGLNLYKYARNNPIVFMDRKGFESVLNLLAEDAEAQRQQDMKEKFDKEFDDASQGPSDEPVKEDSVPGGVKEEPQGGKQVEYKAEPNRIEAQDQAVSGFEAGVANSAIEFVQGTVKSGLDEIPGHKELGIDKHIDAYFDSLKTRPPDSDAGGGGYFAGVWAFNTAMFLITAGATRALGGAGGASAEAVAPEAAEGGSARPPVTSNEGSAGAERGPALAGDPAATKTVATLNKGQRRTQINVGDAYSYGTATDGEVVGKLAKDLETSGKKVVVGTGGHGEYGTNNNFTNTAALEEDQFLLEDLDLGWDSNIEILDLSNPTDYAKFKAAEDAARLGGGNTATIRAWCFGGNHCLH